MSTWLALALSYAGFAFLAMAMKRYALDMLGYVLTLGKQRAARVTGTALLVISLVLCVHVWGGSVGSTVWLVLLTLSGLGLGLQLTYKPRQVILLAMVLASLGLTASVFIAL